MNVGNIGKRKTNKSKPPHQALSTQSGDVTPEPHLAVENTPTSQEPAAESDKEVAEIGDRVEQQHPAQQNLSAGNMNDSRQDEADSSTEDQQVDGEASPVAEVETLLEQGQSNTEVGPSWTGTKEPVSAPTGISPAVAAPESASGPTTLKPFEWRQLLDGLEEHFPKGIKKLRRLKAAERNVRLVRELVAEMRCWVDYAERVISSL